jgi:hypothetical protein
METYQLLVSIPVYLFLAYVIFVLSLLTVWSAGGILIGVGHALVFIGRAMVRFSDHTLERWNKFWDNLWSPQK